MTDVPKEHIELASVEAEIAARRLRLRFASAMEKAFELHAEDERILNMVWASFAAIVLYDIFLVNDWMSLHDRFREMVVARFGIFTPVILVFIAVGHRTRSARLAEWMTVIGAVLAVALPMLIMLESDSPHKLTYQFGSALVMMFATVIQNIRFRPAIFVLVGTLAIQLTVTYVSHAFDQPIYVAIVSFFGAAAALQLLAVYLMEKAERRTFLFALRGRLLHEQLDIAARTDALTGLYNRRHMAEFSQEVWAHPTPRRVSAILIDLDHFKLFNDSRGHLEGDNCLRAVAACIQRTATTNGASAFRFGGEEMVVLLPGADPGDARRVANDIRNAIAALAIPHPALYAGAVVSASFGVAGVVTTDSSAADLIAAADTALYAAKRAGRNRIWPPPHDAVTVNVSAWTRKSA